MMKASYDLEADAFAAWFAPEGVTSERTKEVAPGVFVGFDADGGRLGLRCLAWGGGSTGHTAPHGKSMRRPTEFLRFEQVWMGGPCRACRGWRGAP